MRFLRLLLAGMIATAVLVAGFFAAAVLLLTGLIGYVVQRVRGQPAPKPTDQSTPPNRERPLASGEVIDVEVTKIPADTGRP